MTGAFFQHFSGIAVFMEPIIVRTQATIVLCFVFEYSENDTIEISSLSSDALPIENKRLDTVFQLLLIFKSAFGTHLNIRIRSKLGTHAEAELN